MRSRRPLLLAGLLTGALAAMFYPREAHAQAIPPSAERNESFGVASTITMAIGAATVSLMPRVYYNDPEATVGWKARWHLSQLAPVMTLVGATLLVDIPIKNLGEGTRPGCTVEETESGFDGSNCESYGMPSTHDFAAYSAFGAGVAIWVVDLFQYNDMNFNAGSFIGDVVVPLGAAVATSVFRGIGGDQAYEDPAQIGVGVAAGTVAGLLTGIVYAMFQEPGCGYGNNIFCW
ncbi:MAG: hypothetical protein U0271_39655 [Polyangiaceae bacterium]